MRTSMVALALLVTSPAVGSDIVQDRFQEAVMQIERMQEQMDKCESERAEDRRRCEMELAAQRRWVNDQLADIRARVKRIDDITGRTKDDR